MRDKPKATEGEVITVDGDKEFQQTAGIYLPEDGDIELKLRDMDDGESLTFEGVAGGMVHPIIATEVKEDGTTVSNFIALR